MQYVIKGDPGKLACARYAPKKIYDIQKHSRMHAEIDLRCQHGDKPLYQKPIHFDVYFYMLTNKNSKRSGAYNPYSPSLAKLIRFVEDLFKDIVIKDSYIIASLTTHKKFSTNPRTEVTITPARK